MSDACAQNVDGFAISPESLACGLAVATGTPVITPDVLEEALEALDVAGDGTRL